MNINILIVDDEEEHSYIIYRYLLKGFGESVAVQTTNSLENASELMKKYDFDVLISDLRLGNMSPQETARKLLSWTHRFPIVVVTSFSDVEFAQVLLRQGIQDYMTKDELSVNLIKRVVLFSLERRKFETKLYHFQEDLDIFLRTFLHDLSNPLTSFIVGNKILQGESERQEKTGIQQSVDTSIEKMLGIIQCLQDLIRANKLSYFEMVEIPKVVEQMKSNGKNGLPPGTQWKVALETISLDRLDLEILLRNAIWGPYNSIQKKQDHVLSVELSPDGATGNLNLFTEYPQGQKLLLRNTLNYLILRRMEDNEKIKIVSKLNSDSDRDICHFQLLSH